LSLMILASFSLACSFDNFPGFIVASFDCPSGFGTALNFPFWIIPTPQK